MVKTNEPIFTQFGGNVAHGPQKKPLDFAVSPDHITFGLGHRCNYG